MYTLYVHINKINKKAYVGITGKTPEERWNNGKGYRGQPFYNAIKKYGWDGFEHIILKEGLSQQEADKLEQEYIEKFDSFYHGYNSTKGGFSDQIWTWSEKWNEDNLISLRKQISESVKKAKSNTKKKIICINTQKIYDREEEIEKEYNIKQATILERCYNERIGTDIDPVTKRNLIFLYYDSNSIYDYSLYNTIIRIAKNPIICLETKEIFCSMGEAARVNELKFAVVQNSCIGKSVYSTNLHFMFYNEYINSSSEKLMKRKNNTGRKRKIVLVNTGEIFNSISEASRKYNVDYASIVECVNNTIMHAGLKNNVLLIWQDYEEYLVNPKIINIQVGRKPVHCLTNNLFFSSLKAAGEYYHTDPNDISRCCMGILEYNGKDEKGNLLKWEYYYPSLEDNIEVIA